MMPLGTACADPNTNFTKIMATKKITPKTTKSADEKTAPAAAPAAKKTANKVTKTTAAAGEKTEEKPVAKKTAVKKSATPKTAVKITPDALARAAYLNYRRRVEQGLPGDSHGDWLEAERSLGKTSDS